MFTFTSPLHSLPWPRSISARLAFWFTVAASTLFAILFGAGFLLLENHLIHGLDGLNASEFAEIKSHVFRDFDANDPQLVERRMRRPSERTASLFFIQIDNIRTGAIFRSHNLRGHPIPDHGTSHAYNVALSGIGELRVAEYTVDPLIIRIGTPVQGVRNVMFEYRKIFLTLLAVMVAASLAIGFFLSRMALAPIRAISVTAEHIRSDNLAERIPVGKVKDEISGLATMLNRMFDRLESSFIQIRRFAADASHELKTPLSLVRLHAEKMLSDDRLLPEHHEALQVQLEEIARLDQLIEELLFLSRANVQAMPLELRHANPARFLNLLAQDARVLAEHHGLAFAYAHDGEDKLLFDENRMRQVLLNLLSNAFNVSPRGGHVTLRSVVGDGLWRVKVEDEGPGLPAHELDHVFNRFVRLTMPGKKYKGSGLGLAISRSIVELHGGRIFAKNSATGIGLNIVIEIPAGSVLPLPSVRVEPVHDVPASSAGCATSPSQPSIGLP
jgi:two-component system heavy metal sensor histidine kinase CusS